MVNFENTRPLHATALFQDLSPDEQAALEQRLPQATFEAGALLYSPEERGEVLFLLKQGRVRLYRLSPDGKTLTTAIVEPGAAFGEMALLGQGMQDSFAETMEKSVLYTLHKRDVQDVLLSDPRISRRLIELVSRRLEETEKKLAEFAFKNVPQRLASLLLQLAHAAPGQHQQPLPLPMRYTHQQLAEMIGTYRETVTKVLNDFRQQGWIRIEHGRIVLVDPVALETIIAG